MVSNMNPHDERRGRLRLLPRLLIAGCACAGALAAGVWMGRNVPAAGEDVTRPGAAAEAQALPSSLEIHDMPKPMPGLAFTDPAGRVRHISDWRGTVVLLNLWATWCAPCKQEMPTLERLAGTLDAGRLAVIALSVDRGSFEAPQAYFTQQHFRHLTLAHDAGGKALSLLGAEGLPLSVIIDRDGREIARKLGPAEWDTGEAARFITQAATGP